MARADSAVGDEILVEYGQHLWYQGAPYGRFANTVNMVTSRLPGLRRATTGFWNLAFQWLHQEPMGHHLAMPGVCSSALVGLALLWRWPRVAALLAAGRCGLLRPAEFLSARRRHLVLQRDSMGIVS